MQKLYTAEEIAKMFSIEVETVWLWFRQGKLRYTKIGKRKLVKESDLQKIVEDGDSDGK